MKPLRQYEMQFIPIIEDKPVIEHKELGLRSKLGGKPDWEQYDETPICPSCNEKMTFIGQIDSIEHDEPHNPHAVDCLSDDQRYMFGDVGIIYIFFCFDCLETISVFQCG
ncbi:MAG: hypothetical protein ACE14V_00175 [bacterium]